MDRPLSATQWIFGDEPLRHVARRLAELGYDGIELSGDTDSVTPEQVRKIVEPLGLRVTSICGLYTSERDLSHPDRGRRRAAVDYVRRCIELGAGVGAAVVIVVPAAVGRIRPLADRQSEWGWAGESLSALAESVPPGGPLLVLEALNRYETHLVNTVAQADQLRRETESARIAIMADVFHMNIEEHDVVETMRAHGTAIRHVHLADSNRREPGAGHVDFARVLAALESEGYAGALAMEFLPADQDRLARGLAHVRSLQTQVRQSTG